MAIVKKMFYTTISIFAFVILLANISNADTVKITTETLNLREEPSTNSDIVAQISIGEECNVISDEGDWYEVEYGEYTGYISKEYAELVGDSTNTSNETSDNTNTVDENKSADNNSNTSSNTTTESGTNNGEDNTSNTNDNQPADNSTSTTLTGRINKILL